MNTIFELNGIYLNKDNKYSKCCKIVKLTKKFVFFIVSDIDGNFYDETYNIMRLSFDNFKKCII